MQLIVYAHNNLNLHGMSLYLNSAVMYFHKHVNNSQIAPISHFVILWLCECVLVWLASVYDLRVTFRDMH